MRGYGSWKREFGWERNKSPQFPCSRPPWMTSSMLPPHQTPQTDSHQTPHPCNYNPAEESQVNIPMGLRMRRKIQRWINHPENKVWGETVPYGGFYEPNGFKQHNTCKRKASNKVIEKNECKKTFINQQSPYVYDFSPYEFKKVIQIQRWKQNLYLQCLEVEKQREPSQD